MDLIADSEFVAKNQLMSDPPVNASSRHYSTWPKHGERKDTLLCQVMTLRIYKEPTTTKQRVSDSLWDLGRIQT